MGFGDSILAAAHAKFAIQAMSAKKVAILDATGTQYWDDLWKGLDYIAKLGEVADIAIVNGPSQRLYYKGMNGDRILWVHGAPRPGEIRLTDDEKAWAVKQFEMGDQHPRCLVINPTWKEKGGGGANKDWGLDSWKKVAAALDDILLIQFTPPFLPGTIKIPCPTFRHACAILDRCIGYVGHEGGLHHAAAALGKPGVVVFGGYISPKITGYDSHTNLYVPSDRFPLGCGTVVPCEHCRESMDKITVEQVVEAVRKVVKW